MEGDSDNEEDESKLTNGDTSRDLMNYDDDVNDPVNVSYSIEIYELEINCKYLFSWQGLPGKNFSNSYLSNNTNINIDPRNHVEIHCSVQIFSIVNQFTSLGFMLIFKLFFTTIPELDIFSP